MAGVKKFVLVHHGNLPQTPLVRAAWEEWVQRRSANIADLGGSFGPGRLVTTDRTFELTRSTNPANGYTIVWAPHLDAAEQLLEGCPIAESVSVYETIDPLTQEIQP